MSPEKKTKSLMARIKDALEVVCDEGPADMDALAQALDFLDSVKGEPSLSPHLAHQLERRSYGKALDSCRNE